MECPNTRVLFLIIEGTQVVGALFPSLDIPVAPWGLFHSSPKVHIYAGSFGF